MSVLMRSMSFFLEVKISRPADVSDKPKPETVSYSWSFDGSRHVKSQPPVTASTLKLLSLSITVPHLMAFQASNFGFSTGLFQLCSKEERPAPPASMTRLLLSH